MDASSTDASVMDACGGETTTTSHQFRVGASWCELPCTLCLRLCRHDRGSGVMVVWKVSATASKCFTSLRRARRRGGVGSSTEGPKVLLWTTFTRNDTAQQQATRDARRTTRANIQQNPTRWTCISSFPSRTPSSHLFYDASSSICSPVNKVLGYILHARAGSIRRRPRTPGRSLPPVYQC